MKDKVKTCQPANEMSPQDRNTEANTHSYWNARFSIFTFFCHIRLQINCKILDHKKFKTIKYSEGIGTCVAEKLFDSKSRKGKKWKVDLQEQDKIGKGKIVFQAE